MRYISATLKLWRDRSGQGALEYGLILGLVAMVAIGALLVLGSGSSSPLSRAGHSISGDTSTLTSGNEAAPRTAPQ
jgi:Flp pilus assembly pilin Flp